MLTGRTVHVVPAEGGLWQVVDLRRHVKAFYSREAAVEHAKAVALANQPSQVVLFDERGRLEPIARYQLPQYPPLHLESGGSFFEAAAKAVLIGGLTAAGVAVLSDVVDGIERDLKKGNGKSGSSKRRKRSRSK